MSKQEHDERGVGVEVAVTESMLRELVSSLSVVDDLRWPRGLRHPVLNVLTIAVLGCMCGCDDAEALEDWGKKEADWLAGFLELPHGTPSQDVFLRVLAAIDPASFRQVFHSWVTEVFSQLGLQRQIAIDGQTHRGSGDKGKNQKPLHMVHALLCETGLVLGQVATQEKSNEITAIPALLRVLDLRGALVSIDTMGTQVGIARTIADAGGDYLLALKGNHSSLKIEVEQAVIEALDPRRRTVDEVAPPHGRPPRTGPRISSRPLLKCAASRWATRRVTPRTGCGTPSCTISGNAP